MTMPSSGPISLSQANVELGFSATVTISLNQASVRSLFGVASGAIAMSNGYGKSNVVTISYTFTSSTVNASLNLSSISGYSAGKSIITVTVNSGVYLWANSTGNYGLSLTGGTTGDTLTLVNNGFIMGQGGSGTTAQNGGPALNIAGLGISGLTLDQTNGSAYIGGGGGGGGVAAYSGSGGGAGGGAGGTNQGQGGGGGGIGSSGGNGSCSCDCGTRTSGGGGGGRIFPGSGGSNGGSVGGGGGAGGGGGRNTGGVSYRGAGGSANNAGGAGANFWSGSGGGGWGASGGINYQYGGAEPPYSPGGTGGKAINTGGKSITYVSGVTARVWGAVS